MKKCLIIQLEGAVIEPGESDKQELMFEAGVIHNLYRINQQLGYELVFLRESKYSDELYSKALNVLKRESVKFSVVTISETVGETEYSITRAGNRFKIASGNTVIDVANWDEIYYYLRSSVRKISHSRNTNETKIQIAINIDGSGKYNISTGLGFFDHMLEQFSKHSNIDIDLHVQGDLHIDEHHTIEDTAIALGEAILQALGNKKGIERYGFLLPMDDCLAQAAIDFSGRSWLVWDVDFKREFIGDMPTEMFYHFFKSFCDAAKCNLNIKAEGTNEHHKIESIFKAFAKAVKMAVAVDHESSSLPTTKGVL